MLHQKYYNILTIVFIKKVPWEIYNGWSGSYIAKRLIILIFKVSLGGNDNHH
jgi:hypothetical protein